MKNLLLLVVFLGVSFAAHADTRAAFVVGNSAYENAPALSNPARDARLVADTLRQLGFTVTRHEDLTRDGFAVALEDFLRTNRDADVTFFYFAGHGMQFDGKNYLVGTDAELRSELDIDSETIELDKVVDLLERNSNAALVFVDACRDNPLATDFYRRNFSETRALETRGLARVRSAIDGSMLVFAAAPGQVAYDGDELNSPFAAALARHLPTEGTEILSLTKRIIGDV
ncbi:MAG TPA: caspase family protein, partial [Planctomycetaceae bacterium]|nr:caspase family protein [Planctomycetaceae bacterium]